MGVCYLPEHTSARGHLWQAPFSAILSLTMVRADGRQAVAIGAFLHLIFPMPLRLHNEQSPP